MINYIIGGIICLLFAYLIGVKKILVLLINYNDFTFLGDKEKLSKRMGIILFIIGVFTIFMPLLLMVFGVLIKSIYTAIIIALVLLASLFIVVPYFQIK
ncbi:succinate-acetate transporter protein [Bacillus atrophaeus]|nr:succinate-acetate transporter protein [Bacillus atrophaeus]